MKATIILCVVLFCVVWLMHRPSIAHGCDKLTCKVGEILEWALVAQVMIIINKLLF
ncbi:MAG: hypothetical protein K6C34_02030 [Alphaproteobacteria bacterium]|nr:hypothetical protein [Alphaproteobacteria bacterium]